MTAAAGAAPAVQADVEEAGVCDVQRNWHQRWLPIRLALARRVRQRFMHELICSDQRHIEAPQPLLQAANVSQAQTFGWI
jgi:hypothetical protein